MYTYLNLNVIHTHKHTRTHTTYDAPPRITLLPLGCQLHRIKANAPDLVVPDLGAQRFWAAKCGGPGRCFHLRWHVQKAGGERNLDFLTFWLPKPARENSVDQTWRPHLKPKWIYRERQPDLSYSHLKRPA